MLVLFLMMLKMSDLYWLVGFIVILVHYLSQSITHYQDGFFNGWVGDIEMLWLMNEE